MTREEQKKMGLTMIETLVEELEKNRAAGYLRQAKGAFERACGVLLALAITEIISSAEEKELREELYQKHYVYVQ